MGTIAPEPLEISPEIPEVVILRLPLYIRALRKLAATARKWVRSEELGNELQMSPAQIRKDLSYFGRFGKQGQGYEVRVLLEDLTEILGLNREWPTALVGIGRLGKAILGYPGLAPEGFKIVAAFDADPQLIGQEIGGLVVQDPSELRETVKAKNIAIGIVAVPASSAQEVIDRLVAAGVRAILNYAPITPKAPQGFRVRNVDPVLQLQSMTYYLKGEYSSSSSP